MTQIIQILAHDTNPDKFDIANALTNNTALRFVIEDKLPEGWSTDSGEYIYFQLRPHVFRKAGTSSSNLTMEGPVLLPCNTHSQKWVTVNYAPMLRTGHVMIS